MTDRIQYRTFSPPAALSPSLCVCVSPFLSPLYLSLPLPPSLYLSPSLSHLELVARVITLPRLLLVAMRCSSVREACFTHRLGLSRKRSTVAVSSSRILVFAALVGDIDII